MSGGLGIGENVKYMFLEIRAVMPRESLGT